jgi:hypothetical membrane protein
MGDLQNHLKKDWKKSKLGSICGVLGPSIVFLGILISAVGYHGVQGQRYSPLNHFVSELGEIGVSDLAVVFNISLIIGGVLNAVFIFVLAKGIRGWLRYPLAALGLAAAICGGLVGVFPMDRLDQHIIVALGFFNLGQLAALAFSLVFLFGKNHPYPRWLSIPGFLNTGAFLAFNNFPSQIEEGVDFRQGMDGLLTNRPDFIPLALLEWVVILGILIWFFLLGIYMLRNGQRFQGK